MTLFLRLLDKDDKEESLAAAVEQLREGAEPEFEVDPQDFGQVPGSPFAYWISSDLRGVFTNHPPFETARRRATKGLATTDDFQFLRCWWEINPGCIAVISTDTDTPTQQERWVPFAKGGGFSPYYDDLHLLINWGYDGQRLKKYLDNKIGKPGQWSRWINSVNYYFQPGLTWPLRASRFAPYVLPQGSIFSVRGYVIIAPTNDLKALLGLCNSTLFDFIFKVKLGRFGFPEFVVGALQQLPVPNITDEVAREFAELALSSYAAKRELDRANELSHVFHLPQLLLVEGSTLAARVSAWESRERETAAQLDHNQAEIDEIAFQLYGINEADREAIRTNSGLPITEEDVESNEDADDNSTNLDLSPIEEDVESNEDADDEQPATSSTQLARDLVSYAVGCAFGRWDLRFATGLLERPNLPDPFAPLPTYSPGMLRRDENSLLGLRPDQNGILADDEDDVTDIIRCLRNVFDIIWDDRAEAIERELCEMLDDRPIEKRKPAYQLRNYIRKSGKSGFWQYHIQRYSKSRRKAPIYWLLQSPKGRYALWLYYPKYNGDTLAQALQNYVEPKLRRELERLASLRSEASNTAIASQRRKREAEVERQEELLNDIQEFRDRLERAARRGLRPDHNDGVLLNIAPLWELTPWLDAKRAWEDLQAGEYEWSTVSKQLRGVFEPEPADNQAAPDNNEGSGSDQGEESAKTVAQSQKREPRTILGRLRLRDIGPTAELDLSFDERINIMTGDNGLGKTFVLDAAWLALTGVELPEPIRPSSDQETSRRPEINYEIVSTTGQLQEIDTFYFNARQDLWQANETTAGSVQPRPGLVMYVRVDGGIAIWDRFKRAALERRGVGPALVLDGSQLWKGRPHHNEQLCRGVIEDTRDWWRAADRRAERAANNLPPIEDGDEARQAILFDTLQAVLACLSPGEDERMELQQPKRVGIVNTIEYPHVRMSYGSVPVIHASAAVRRVLGIAYALVWAYDEHRRAAAASEEQPSRQMIMLLDEVELHLHPKWQRRIVPALLAAIKLLDEHLHAQILITTHAPLVLASLEPHFEEERDQLFDFDLTDDGQVKLTARIWAKQGDAANWLVSEVFNLSQARSPEAEHAIAAAMAYLRGDTMEGHELQTRDAIQHELSRLLPEHDSFWARWSLGGGEQDDEALLRQIDEDIDRMLQEDD